MEHLSKTILAVLAAGLLSCGLFSQQAQAAEINGSINFAGAVHLDNNNLSLAHAVLNWFDAFNDNGFSTVVPGATGDFSGIPGGTSAAMTQPWTFNPSTPTPALWSVGGFTFDLGSASVDSQSTHFLNVLGTGTMSGNGFDPTPGVFSFQVNNASGRNRLIFSFAANGSSVPDGGATVMLLGTALGALGIVRRSVLG